MLAVDDDESEEYRTMLLEYIYKKSGVLYMSDLKIGEKWKPTVEDICADQQLLGQYSVKDWRDALVYLKNEKLESDNVQDYIDRLIK